MDETRVKGIACEREGGRWVLGKSESWLMHITWHPLMCVCVLARQSLSAYVPYMQMHMYLCTDAFVCMHACMHARLHECMLHVCLSVCIVCT